VILQPSAHAGRQRRRLAWALAPALPGLLAAVLASIAARRSFSLTEVEWVLTTRQPWRALVPFDPADPSGALYRVALKGWLHAGSQEWIARVPSIAAFALAASVVSLLGGRLFDRRVGLAAGLVFAATASMAGLGRSVGPLPLAVLAVAVATWLVAVAIESDALAAWAAYVPVAAAAVYLHASAVLVLAAHGVAAAISPAVRRRALLAAALVALAAIPAAVPVVLHRRHLVDALAQPSLEDVGRAVHDAVGRNGALLGLAAVGVLALLLLRVPRAEPWKTTLLVAAAVLPLAGTLALSMVRPSLDPRYLAVSVPAWSLLVATGMRMLRREVALVALGGLLALSGLRLADVVGETPETWRSAVAAAFAAREPDDRVVGAPARAIGALAYYAGAGRGSVSPKGPTVFVVVRARDLQASVAAARATVRPPAYALRDTQRLSRMLWLQRWERTGLREG
jgi:mannosyltransferase